MADKLKMNKRTDIRAVLDVVQGHLLEGGLCAWFEKELPEHIKKELAPLGFKTGEDYGSGFFWVTWPAGYTTTAVSGMTIESAKLCLVKALEWSVALQKEIDRLYLEQD